MILSDVWVADFDAKRVLAGELQFSGFIGACKVRLLGTGEVRCVPTGAVFATEQAAREAIGGGSGTEDGGRP